MDFLS
ncbi:hypothetical protein F383_07596 [Gossypium arboreum]|jgi:hypothetical protein